MIESDKSRILNTSDPKVRKTGSCIVWSFSFNKVHFACDSTVMEEERQQEVVELGNGKGAVVKAVALETI